MVGLTLYKSLETLLYCKGFFYSVIVPFEPFA